MIVIQVGKEVGLKKDSKTILKKKEGRILKRIYLPFHKKSM